MTTADERLLEWLRDAHAMEEQAETMLESQIKRLEHYPEITAKLKEHLEETRRQAQLVNECIERRAGSSSAVKDVAAKMMAAAQGLSGLFVGDEVIKGALASYTFEQMEIASYRILIVAAEAVGDTATAGTCTQILREEEAMAAWLDKNMPGLVRKYLAREETPGVEAKH